MPWYFLSTIIYFYIPSAFLSAWILPRIDQTTRKAYWKTMGYIACISITMEYVYLGLDLWTFSEAKDPLLGIRIYGAPIEEFIFWFGACPFALLIYLSLCRVFKPVISPPPQHAAGRALALPHV